jgi:phage-related protein
MSKRTYAEAARGVAPADEKPLVWLHGEVKTPPFGRSARLETGFLLRLLQRGEKLSFPHSRPMPSIGPRCHELRVTDLNTQWRLVYRTDDDAIVIADVFAKKSATTLPGVIATCQERLKRYDDAQAKAKSSRGRRLEGR